MVYKIHKCSQSQKASLNVSLPLLIPGSCEYLYEEDAQQLAQFLLQEVPSRTLNRALTIVKKWKEEVGITFNK